MEGTSEQVISFDAIFSDPKFAKSLYKMMNLLIKLDDAGILDVLSAVTDKSFIEKATEFAISSELFNAFLNLMANSKKVSEVINVLCSESKNKADLNVLMKSMEDEEFQKGLAKLIEIVKILGK